MLLRGAGELTKGVIYGKSPLQMARPQSPGWHLQQEWHPSLLDASLSPLCVRAAETRLQASKLARIEFYDVRASGHSRGRAAGDTQYADES